MKKYLLFVGILLRLIVRFFTANIYGIFILFVSIYYISPYVNGVQPFKLNDLIVWFSEQSDTLQSLFLSSLVTVIGFIIAFQSATKNWKDQLVANIRVQASNDIDTIYTRINEIINSLKIYTDTNLKILSRIKSNADVNEIYSNIKFVLSQTEKFRSERQELSSLQSRAFQLYGRYSLILFATLNAFEQLEKINESVRKVAGKMWILLPTIDISNSDYLKHYLNYVDEEKYMDLSNQCGESYLYISAIAGNVRGKLTTNIAELNLIMLFNFIRRGKIFMDFWAEIKEFDKKHQTNKSFANNLNMALKDLRQKLKKL
jgi:hypothetical protein